jgi:hypothetical protein
VSAFHLTSIGEMMSPVMNRLFFKVPKKLGFFLGEESRFQGFWFMW